MNENDEPNIETDDIHNIYFDINSKQFDNTRSNALDGTLNVLLHQSLHIHNSKCFITNVFLYSINFILNKKSRDELPNLQIDERNKVFTDLNDDGFNDDYQPSDRWSSSSDISHTVSSARSSEGFQEIDKPIDKNCRHNKILNQLDSNMRLSLCDSCISLPRFSELFYLSLDEVLLYFENKYNSCHWLRSSVSELNQLEFNKIHEELYKIYDAIFSGRTSWSRIVVMIGFVCELSICALNTDKIAFVERYIETSVCYVHDNLMDWIVDQGGWEALVDFCAKQREDSEDLERIFGTMGRVAAVLAVALAGIIICKYVADHI